MTRRRRHGRSGEKPYGWHHPPREYSRRDKEHCRLEGIPQWLRRYGRQHAGGTIYSSFLLTRIERPHERRDRRGRVAVQGHPAKIREYRADIGGVGWVKAYVL